MTDAEHETENREEKHSFEGVGRETRVYCPENGLLSVSEPQDFDPDYCPYCGGDTENDSHRVDSEVCEVFCENSTQSTWRYCPMCGDSNE